MNFKVAVLYSHNVLKIGGIPYRHFTEDAYWTIRLWKIGINLNVFWNTSNNSKHSISLWLLGFAEPPEPTLGTLSLKYDCFLVIDAHN